MFVTMGSPSLRSKALRSHASVTMQKAVGRTTAKAARSSARTATWFRTDMSLIVPTEIATDCRSNKTAFVKSPTRAVPATMASVSTTGRPQMKRTLPVNGPGPMYWLVVSFSPSASARSIWVHHDRVRGRASIHEDQPLRGPDRIEDLSGGGADSDRLDARCVHEVPS